MEKTFFKLSNVRVFENTLTQLTQDFVCGRRFNVFECHRRQIDVKTTLYIYWEITKNTNKEDRNFDTPG